MIEQELKYLIQKLIEKTASKNAIWTRTSRDNEFKLELQNGAVTVDSWFNNISSADFAIINQNGDIIQRVVLNDDDADYQLLIELHELAKRAYFKVDDTIRSIFIELEQKKIVGKEDKTPRKSDDLPF